MRQGFAAFVALLSLSPSARAQSALSEQVRPFVSVDAPVIAITHARVIDGTGAPARAEQTIVIERGIIRERTTAGLDAARARGRVGGRPKSLTEADLGVARTLLKDGDLTIAQVAERLGVAASTLYAHLPRPRSTITIDAPAE